MIDFKTKTGENVGKIKVTELANFMGISEGALRNRRKKNPKEFEIYYLGALCLANGVTEQQIIEISSK